MENSQCIDVRVDYYRNGDFFPISFIDVYGKTYYIRGIKKIENRFITLKKFEKLYFCITAQKDVLLVMIDDKWYLKEE